MKHLALALLLCSAFAGTAPMWGDYSINVHVNATRMVRDGHTVSYYQSLSVIIDGKKCELESLDVTNGLLALGDYKARLVKDQHLPAAYDSWRVYEFLLPDNKKRQFVVVGQSE